jgi:hypothetical protein
VSKEGSQVKGVVYMDFDWKASVMISIKTQKEKQKFSSRARTKH